LAEIAIGRVISGAREISHDRLMERAACAATGLGELGVGAGDAIGVVLRNDFAFFEASYAAQRLGAYSVPINWHGKTQEIAYVLRDCGAKVVVAHADLLPEVAPAIPPGCRFSSCRRRLRSRPPIGSPRNSASCRLMRSRGMTWSHAFRRCRKLLRG